jgi:hypothetical protein
MTNLPRRKGMRCDGATAARPRKDLGFSQQDVATHSAQLSSGDRNDPERVDQAFAPTKTASE